MNVKDRFYKKVNRSGECWLWLAGKNNGGYGVFWFDKKMQCAHRASYEIHNGPIPDGLYVLHTCDNPGCVNPGHLFVGDQTANMQDMIKKNRQHTGTRTGNYPSGERNHNAVLCELDVWLIKNCEATQQKVAHFFGISQPHVSGIKSGKRWAHF